MSNNFLLLEYLTNLFSQQKEYLLSGNKKHKTRTFLLTVNACSFFPVLVKYIHVSVCYVFITINLSVYQLHLSTSLSISVSPSTHSSAHSSIIQIHSPISLPTIYLFVCLSIYLPACLPTAHPSILPSIYRSISLSITLPIYLVKRVQL